jgi:hypothetical protein
MRVSGSSVLILIAGLSSAVVAQDDPCANLKCPTNCPQGLCAIQRFGNECSAYCASLQVPNMGAAAKSVPFELNISNMTPETAKKIKELLEKK